MIYYFKVLMTNPLLNVPLGPSEVVVSNKNLCQKRDYQYSGPKHAKKVVHMVQLHTVLVVLC